MGNSANSKKTQRVRKYNVPDKKRLLYTILVLVSLSLFSYSTVFDNSFTNWDDEEMLVNNSSVRSLSVGNIYNIFTTCTLSHYHPLVTISYALEYRFFELDPFIFHLTNLLLHIFSSVLVYLVFWKLLENMNMAAVIALLFAVHPVHVESVAWVTERKDMLYMAFYLLALLMYILSKTAKKRNYSTFLYLFFILSCFSKASAVTLPLILLAIDYYYNNRLSKKDISDKLPLILISLIFGIININAQYKMPFDGAELEIPHYTYIERALIVFYNYCYYIYKTVFPFQLSAFYPYPEGSLSILYVLAPLLTVLIFYLAIKSARGGNRIVFLGFLIYTITILPVLQIVPVGRAIAADRFVYFPITGLFLIIAYYANSLYSSKIRQAKYKRALQFVFLICLLVFSLLSRQQADVWQNSYTLYTGMIAENQGNSVAFNNRAVLFLNDKKYEEAERDLKKAILINPKYPAALNNLGLVNSGRGDYDKAISFFEEAIRLDPLYAEAFLSLGIVYANKKENERSAECYRTAIKIDPEFAQAYNNLGKALAAMGKDNEAIECFSKAVLIAPDYCTAHYNLAVAYLKTGSTAPGLNEMKISAKLGNAGAIDFCRKNKIPYY